MLTRRRKSGRACGFSLVEMAVSLAVLGLLLGLVAMIQERGNNASEEALARASAEARLRRALDRVAADLTGIGRTLLFPDPTTPFGSSTATFQHPSGVSGTGAVLWDTPSRIEILLDPRETDNGIDDDGDGLADERRLVRTVNVGTGSQRSTTLCNGIPELMGGETVNGLDDNGNGITDEAGFNIRRTGDLLTVRLSVQQAFGDGQVATATMETSIVLHN
ncbi:MAG: prepilin-type N-terminal cleavage/methylation domain-containing protein [Planctomycetota bacterium]